MLEILILPFRVAFEIVSVVMGIVGGLLELIFGLLGGFLSLAVGVAVFALVAGLIIYALRRRKGETYYVDGEEFTSYYHQR